jgi:hypothetical protein
MPRTPRPIKFVCDWCNTEKTEQRMPGPVPTFCQECAPEARRMLATARMRRLREQRAGPYVVPRPRGRPKGS